MTVGEFAWAPWWYYLLLVAVTALGLWCTAVVLTKAGFAPWWALLFLAPMLYLIGMWLFAFVRWPRMDRVHVTPPSDYSGGWNVPPRDDDGDGRPR